MLIGPFALASRRDGMLCVNWCCTLALGAVLLCLAAPETRAQAPEGVFIGGITGDKTVCTKGGIVYGEASGSGPGPCDGTLAVDDQASNGNLTATGTISGGTIVVSTGDLLLSSGGDLKMNGGDITGVARIGRQNGNFSTLTTSGHAKLDSLEVTHGAIVNGDLEVKGVINATTLNSTTIVNTGNVKTKTLTVDGTSELNGG